jgi:hypothetical protein
VLESITAFIADVKRYKLGKRAPGLGLRRTKDLEWCEGKGRY